MNGAIDARAARRDAMRCYACLSHAVVVVAAAAAARDARSAAFSLALSSLFSSLAFFFAARSAISISRASARAFASGPPNPASNSARVRYLPSLPRTLFLACADRDAYLATPRLETSVDVDDDAFAAAVLAASFALALRRRRMALYCLAFTYTAASVDGNKTLGWTTTPAAAPTALPPAPPPAAAGTANNASPNGFPPLAARPYALGSIPTRPLET